MSLTKMKVAGIIPARLASSRFPGKPLAKILGKTMIEHVYRRAKLAGSIDELYIATCDREIAEEADKFGCKYIMTSPAHTRGTGRIAEASQQIEADIILNIQGDEPLINPEALDKSISIFKKNKKICCMNWISPIRDWDIFVKQNIVKTAVDRNNKIMYFSRQAIPTSSPGSLNNAFKQMGVYIFRNELLLQYARWNEAPLEKLERVDMLRILEHGYPIEAFITNDMVGVDTKEDLIEVEKILKKDLIYRRIFENIN